jgi:hypothetical protein
VYNTKINHGGEEWGDMDWILLAQDRDQWRAHLNEVMNLRLRLNVRDFLSDYTTGGLS